MKLRLAFLLYKYFPYGGMQRDFRRFVQECQRLGHHCRVYYLSWQGEQLAGVELRQVPVKALSRHRRNERFSAWVEADLAADPVDCVIGFNKMPGLDIYYAADSCYLHKALTERSALYRLGPRFRHFAAYEKAVFGSDSQTQILLISKTEQAKFVQHYGTADQRMHMLPPGIAKDRKAGPNAAVQRVQKRQQMALAETDQAMLFVGSGFIKKGLDRAIAALAASRAEGLPLQLWVVGQDKQQRFARQAKKLGVEQFVHFLGGRDDIPQLLLAADVLIHPALDEAAGIVLLEALVAGLPVVVTDVCGYAHHIEAARAGRVLASPFCAQQLNQALRELLRAEANSAARAAALDYAEREDLYSMHATGAELITQLATEQVGSRG